MLPTGVTGSKTPHPPSSHTACEGDHLFQSTRLHIQRMGHVEDFPQIFCDASVWFYNTFPLSHEWKAALAASADPLPPESPSDIQICPGKAASLSLTQSAFVTHFYVTTHGSVGSAPVLPPVPCLPHQPLETPTQSTKQLLQLTMGHIALGPMH